MKLFILSFVLLTSSAFAQWTSNFSTTLKPKLTISGVECRGGELTNDNREDECAKGQWLVTVDTINTCSNGICTELYARNFVGELVRLPIISVPEIALFDIVAVSPVSKEIKAILKQYRLRDDMNGIPKVIKK